MIIDDDQDDCDIFRDAAMQVADCKCHCINDSRKALSILDRAETYPNVIFLDINIPVIDGISLLKYLKGDPRFSSIPIVMYSTTNNPAEIETCLRMGANRFIKKSVSYQQLVRTLSEIKQEIMSG